MVSKRELDRQDNWPGLRWQPSWDVWSPMRGDDLPVGWSRQRNTNLAMKIRHSTQRLAEISLYLPVPAFSAT